MGNHLLTQKRKKRRKVTEKEERRESRSQINNKMRVVKKNVMMPRIRETGSSKNQTCKFIDRVWEGFLQNLPRKMMMKKLVLRRKFHQSLETTVLKKRNQNPRKSMMILRLKTRNLPRRITLRSPVSHPLLKRNPNLNYLQFHPKMSQPQLLFLKVKVIVQTELQSKRNPMQRLRKMKAVKRKLTQSRPLQPQLMFLQGVQVT